MALPNEKLKRFIEGIRINNDLSDVRAILNRSEKFDAFSTETVRPANFDQKLRVAAKFTGRSHVNNLEIKYAQSSLPISEDQSHSSQ